MSASSRASTRPSPRASLQGGGWMGLVLGPLAWFTHHQTGSDLNFANCQRGSRTTLLLVGGACLAAALVGVAVSAASLMRDPGRAELVRFIATLGVMVSGIAAATIALQMTATLLVPPCFQ